MSKDILTYLCLEFDKDPKKFHPVREIHDNCRKDKCIRGTRKQMRVLFRSGRVQINGRELILAIFKGEERIVKYRVDSRTINSIKRVLSGKSALFAVNPKNYSDVPALENTNIRDM